MHHQRRKSGHNPAHVSSADLRNKSVTVSDMSKPKRPAMPRRHTPVSAQKLGRSPRERERDRHDTWDDERESFPQFCMTCEKQFVPCEHGGIYCSETCRRIDQSSGAQSTMPRSYASANYPFYSAGDPEPRDIVPQASPSRPTSMLFGSSPPPTPGTAAYHSSAVSALRSLNLSARPPSPPSPSGSSGTGHFWPFSADSVHHRSAATSPSTSYSRPSGPYLSATYDARHDGGYYNLGGGPSDRPLPSRNPGSHSRPKSIELVTPMVSR